LEAAGKPGGKRKIAIGAGAGAVLLLIAFGPLNGLKDSDDGLIFYTAARGDLIIEVVESGSIEASESEIIRSKVEGRTTIISIVPEGTFITEKDIEEGKVLVELDSSALRDKEVKQEISVQGELAKYADAKATHEIRINQNESDLKKGELKAKFARMDIEKYLGAETASLFLEGEVEFKSLLASELLGGEALQKKRELESEIDLAKEEVVRAVVRLDWTGKLFDKGYVTRDDLQADELALKRKQVSREQAETALRLFDRYEFEKEAEKRRSDYEEAVKELERTIAKNRAELSKAEAQLKRGLLQEPGGSAREDPRTDQELHNHGHQARPRRLCRDQPPLADRADKRGQTGARAGGNNKYSEHRVHDRKNDRPRIRHHTHPRGAEGLDQDRFSSR